MADLIEIEDKNRKAELILVRVMSEIPTKAEQKQFCRRMGCSWSEYKRLKRKYSRVLKRWRKEKLNGRLPT